MAIRYKIRHAGFGADKKAYPRLVPGEKVTGKQFQAKVARIAARGLPDVIAVMAAQRQVLLEELLDEQSVHVPGIGYFTLSIRGELDENGHLITESARLKVHCRPELDLVGDANQDVHFEFVGQ